LTNNKTPHKDDEIKIKKKNRKEKLNICENLLFILKREEKQI
jgi:hypothetical protein